MTDRPARVAADVVAAADVDPVLWGMSSELLDLRRQLGELHQTLAQKERQLAEARHGGEGSERALSTLRGVLTEMILKGRAELEEARDEATHEMSERLARVRAESDLLVGDAAAALTTVLGRSPEPPRAARHQPASPPSPASGPPPRPRPAQAPPPNGPQTSAVDSSGAGGPGPRLPAPTQTPSYPPPAPPRGDGPVSWPTAVSPPAPRAMNGSSSRRSPVMTVDDDLDERFEQVVGLRRNADFRTPPRGIPAVPPPDATAVTAAVAPAPPPAPVLQRADEAFGEFWEAADQPSTVTAELAGGRLSFSLIDVLLPIIALTLVLIVVLSWFG